MEKRFNLKTCLRGIGCVLSALIVSFGVQAAANNATPREAIVERVVVGPSLIDDYCAIDNLTLIIQGKGFNNGGYLTVALGHIADQVGFTICSQAVDGIEIVAELPALLDAGAYRMELFTGNGVVDYDAYDLTVGAFGPLGMKGDTGPASPAEPRGVEGQGSPNMSVAAAVSSLQILVRRDTRFRIPYNVVIYQDGGTFENGFFVAPTDGVYYIRASMSADIRNDSAPCQLAIMKSQVEGNVEANVRHYIKCGPAHTLQVTALVTLRAGQRVWAEYYARYADTELRFVPERNQIFISQLF